MARARTAEALQTIEEGSITFLARPRVEAHADERADVQRLLLRLSPSQSAYERLIAVGRERLPRRARRDRFWGFVDLVLTNDDMQAALGAQVYGTGTRGLRHLPATRTLASGTYEIYVHEDHAHLSWRVESRAERDSVSADLDLEAEADYILTIANPDPAAWGLAEPPDLQAQLFDDLELHVPIPAPFPPHLQQRFRSRRFAQLDTTGWLDHPGAEIVFVAAGTVAPPPSPRSMFPLCPR